MDIVEICLAMRLRYVRSCTRTYGQNYNTTKGGLHPNKACCAHCEFMSSIKTCTIRNLMQNFDWTQPSNPWEEKLLYSSLGKLLTCVFMASRGWISTVEAQHCSCLIGIIYPKKEDSHVIPPYSTEAEKHSVSSWLYKQEFS